MPTLAEIDAEIARRQSQPSLADIDAEIARRKAAKTKESVSDIYSRILGSVKGGFLNDAGNVAMEAMTAVNRGAVGLLDIIPNQLNNITELAGQGRPAPNISETFPGAVTGDYMEPGLARDAIQTGGEFIAPGGAAGSALRGAAKALPQIATAGESMLPAITRQLGASTPAMDVVGAGLSGIGLEGGGELGEAVAGEKGRAVGEVIGSMAAPLAAAKILPKISPKQAFIKARKLGYRVPPSMAKPTKAQELAEGLSGPVPLKQKMSLVNQKVTNNLIKKEIGYPKGTPLSQEGLEAVRADAGKVYGRAKKLGNMAVDDVFEQDLARIGQEGTAMAKEFPEMMKKDVADMVKGFTGKKQISSEAIVDTVKQLRADATVGFRSQDPGTQAMAKASSKVAGALEDLMERNLATKKVGSEFLKKFKAARQRIAKTYTIEKALKGEDVDAVTLGRMLDKGKPLSGGIKDAAEFGQAFKPAAQVQPPQVTNFRPMELYAPVAAAAASGQPAWLAGMMARPALRALLTSKPYQNMLARVEPNAIKKIIAMPAKSQAGALSALLREFKSLTSTETAPGER